MRNFSPEERTFIDSSLFDGCAKKVSASEAPIRIGDLKQNDQGTA